MKESYLSFKINNEYYAMNVDYIHNIIEVEEITTVPRMPEYFLGVINHRGEAIPVVDARIRFGLPEKKTDYNSCIIITEIKADDVKVMFGILIDEVSEVFSISKTQIQPLDKININNRTQFITGIYKKETSIIFILNPNEIYVEIHENNKMSGDG